jgi:hypothetical protein
VLHKYIASRFRGIGGSKRRQPRKRAFSSHLLQLEERCMMTGVPVPAASLKNQEPLGAIFWNGGDPINKNGGKYGVKSPQASGAMKTITLTNFSNQWIYPFLRTANDGKAGNNYYDPQDYHDKEFREYVGYYTVKPDKTKEYFLGMPPGATIEFQVPLVLWDGGHLTLATDGADLTATKPPMVNLFGYSNDAQIAFASLNQKVANSDWVLSAQNYRPSETPTLMFYYSKNLVATTDGAPAQLVEFTFRDPLLKQLGVTDASQTFPELSYDVSYVNTLHAPAALEASSVPITSGAKASNNLTYYGDPKDWGWNGSNRGLAAFNPLLRDFVQNTPKTKAFIGNYFGGRGWPLYYNPSLETDQPRNLVIPSGANIFDNSPLDTRNPPNANGEHTSQYNSNRWLLSSAGVGPIKASATASGVKTAKPKELTLTFGSDADKAAFGATITKMIELANKNGQKINVTAQNSKLKATLAGTLTRYTPGQGLTGTATVNITQNLPLNAPLSIDFSRSSSDYASTAITNLWYSWAQYYVNTLATTLKNYKQTGQGSLVYSKIGNTGPFLTNQITFAKLPANVAVGMNVTAPTLPKGATVLKIVGNTVYLSQIPNGPASPPSPPQKPVTYTFTLPTMTPLKSSPYTTPYTLAFNDNQLKMNTPAVPNPLAFAGQIYEAMAVEATATGTFPAPPANYLPPTMYVVDNVIKFNADIPTGTKNGWTDKVIAEVRDIVKSILRGVVDFVATPNPKLWYPAPAKEVKGTYFVVDEKGKKVDKQAPFNVFNLDPYVWFVHEVEGLSGYGFSVDDDVANPIASGPTDPEKNPDNLPNDLQVGFAGIKGTGAQATARPFGNQKEWFPTTKFGSITTLAKVGYETIERDKKTVTIPIVTLLPTKENPNPLRVLNQITTPGEGQLGPTITAVGDTKNTIFKPGTRITHFPNGVDVKEKPNLELNQNPVKTTGPIEVLIDAAE